MPRTEERDTAPAAPPPSTCETCAMPRRRCVCCDHPRPNADLTCPSCGASAAAVLDARATALADALGATVDAFRRPYDHDLQSDARRRATAALAAWHALPRRELA